MCCSASLVGCYTNPDSVSHGAGAALRATAAVRSSLNTLKNSPLVLGVVRMISEHAFQEHEIAGRELVLEVRALVDPW